MASCPVCGRVVQAARSSCLYCDAPLWGSATSRPSAAEPLEEALPDSQRILLVVDAAGVASETLARGLGVAVLEAALVSKRGSFHLVRIAPPAEAEETAARLGQAGLRVISVPELEVLEATRPRRVLGGTIIDEPFHLRMEGGETRVVASELLLLVHGPIARHYQTSWEMKRVRSATLEEGYRIHLHARDSARPLEIDPFAFEFDQPNPGSSLLALREWVRSLARGVPEDDGFRRLAPALGPASDKVAGRLGAVESLSPRLAAEEEGPAILDNLLQFRFYSSWRAAVERRHG